MTNRIFIVGHMGTGKFIFSEALANKLGWQIVDANPSIERYIGIKAILANSYISSF